MLVTIKTSNKVWTSPDGKISIWDITDADGNKWQTRSNKIAESIDQALELTTTVSKAGKTYLVQPPRDEESAYAGSRLVQPPSVGQLQAPNATERFEKAVAAFERAVQTMVSGKAPDVTPTEVNDTEIRDFFGIEDDL